MPLEERIKRLEDRLDNMERYFSLVPQDEISERLNMDRIIQLVADHFACTSSEIKSSSRHQPETYARQICMATLKDFFPHLSTTAIGRLLGGRDHTTVMYGLRRVAGKESTPRTRRDVFVVSQKCKAAGIDQRT